jgi:hypothetical protein
LPIAAVIVSASCRGSVTPAKRQGAPRSSRSARRFG